MVDAAHPGRSLPQSDGTAAGLSPEMKLIREKFFRHIGKPIERKEDARLITGKGRFSDDFHLPGQTYAALVRSPYAHAQILSIDVTEALSSPGVLAVLTGADRLADGLAPIPHNPVPSTKYDMKLTGPGGAKPFISPHDLLPVEKVRYVGEGVALVVARTAKQALDAIEKVVVDYAELPHITESLDALAPGAPAVWDVIPDNVFVDTRFGDQAATDAAFAAADHVSRAQFHVQRVTGVPMEPRSALAQYDAQTGRYLLYAGSSGAVRQKHELATILGIEPSRLRVLSFDVGGNFGTRNRVYVEFGLILWASKKIGLPVKYTATRSESFLTDYQGRDLVTRVELALRRDGKFLAMRADNISNAGAYCASLSPLSKGSGLITGSYDIPLAAIRMRSVFTNTMSTQAYRSSGRPEVTYAIERLIEIAAREMGIDSLKLRRKNLVSPLAMPYTNAVGQVYDSGEYEKNMDRARELADWDGFKQRRKAAAKRGKLLGRGFANYVESSIGAPKERAEIEVKPEGIVEVVIGTQPSGQGHETSFAQVVADLVEVPIDKVFIILGDTDIVSVGGGSHSGRSMRHAGTVMAMASADLIAEGRRRAAALFDVDKDDVVFEHGRFAVTGTNHAIELFELAKHTQEIEGPLRVARDNVMHTPVFPNGTAICEVEVDPDTGHVEITRYTSVDDVGRCINPMIVHGQTHGGIAQGVGQAMWEHCYVEHSSGQPLAGSFMDYAMPRSDNMPSFVTEIAEVISPTNPLGIKAGGEGGTTPALAVMVNGILDALKDFGVADLQMPATPERVWRAIQNGKAVKAGSTHRGTKTMANAAPKTIRVIAFPGAPNLPTFAAIEQGYFADEGLTVEVTTTPSSVFQAQKIAAGEFDIAFTAFGNVVAYSEGQGAAEGGHPDYCVIMGATQLELSFVVAPEVKTYQDLRGRSIALDALSTGFAFVLYDMLERGGLNKSDYTFAAVGATPQRWQSVKAGEHAGTLTIEPFTSIAKRSGFNVLSASTQLYDTYQGGIVAARRGWVKENPESAKAFIRSYLKGLAWTLDPVNREAAEALLLSKMPEIQPAAAKAVMDSLLSPRSGLTPKGDILPDGMKRVLALRSHYGTGGRELTNIDKYLELSFFKDAIRAS